MSNLNDIANYLDIKLNKTADAQKKQDKLVFALEHLDAAANMLAEEGNHLMSQAVTELMDRAVKKAEEERHFPEGSKKKLEVAKYLTELLMKAIPEAHKELTRRSRDEEFLEDLSEKILHTYDPKKAYDVVVQDQTKLRNMYDDLSQLDQELGTWQHHSELDGVVEFLLEITGDLLENYSKTYEIFPFSFKKLVPPHDAYKDEVMLLGNETSGEETLDRTIDAIHYDITKSQPELDEITTERFKEHEYLPTDYRNKMEEELEEHHQDLMPKEIRERTEILDVGREPSQDCNDRLNANDAQQLKDLW